MIDKTVILSNMKLITEEDNEALLNLMISKAESSIKSYCNRLDIPDELANALEDLAIYKYRNINAENLKSESSKFGGSSYLDDIPTTIKRELNVYRIVRII